MRNQPKTAQPNESLILLDVDGTSICSDVETGEDRWNDAVVEFVRTHNNGRAKCVLVTQRCIQTLLIDWRNKWKKRMFFVSRSEGYDDLTKEAKDEKIKQELISLIQSIKTLSDLKEHLERKLGPGRALAVSNVMDSVSEEDGGIGSYHQDVLHKVEKGLKDYFLQKVEAGDFTPPEQDGDNLPDEIGHPFVFLKQALINEKEQLIAYEARLSEESASTSQTRSHSSSSTQVSETTASSSRRRSKDPLKSKSRQAEAIFREYGAPGNSNTAYVAIDDHSSQWEGVVEKYPLWIVNPLLSEPAKEGVQTRYYKDSNELRAEASLDPLGLFLSLGKIRRGPLSLKSNVILFLHNWFQIQNVSQLDTKEIKAVCRLFCVQNAVDKIEQLIAIMEYMIPALEEKGNGKTKRLVEKFKTRLEKTLEWKLEKTKKWKEERTKKWKEGREAILTWLKRAIETIPNQAQSESAIEIANRIEHYRCACLDKKIFDEEGSWDEVYSLILQVDDNSRGVLEGALSQVARLDEETASYQIKKMISFLRVGLILIGQQQALPYGYYSPNRSQRLRQITRRIDELERELMSDDDGHAFSLWLDFHMKTYYKQQDDSKKELVRGSISKWLEYFQSKFCYELERQKRVSSKTREEIYHFFLNYKSKFEIFLDDTLDSDLRGVAHTFFINFFKVIENTHPPYDNPFLVFIGENLFFYSRGKSYQLNLPNNNEIYCFDKELLLKKDQEQIAQYRDFIVCYRELAEQIGTDEEQEEFSFLLENVLLAPIIELSKREDFPFCYPEDREMLDAFFAVIALFSDMRRNTAVQQAINKVLSSLQEALVQEALKNPRSQASTLRAVKAWCLENQSDGEDRMAEMFIHMASKNRIEKRRLAISDDEVRAFEEGDTTTRQELLHRANKLINQLMDQTVRSHHRRDWRSAPTSLNSSRSYPDPEEHDDRSSTGASSSTDANSISSLFHHNDRGPLVSRDEKPSEVIITKERRQTAALRELASLRKAAFERGDPVDYEKLDKKRTQLLVQLYKEQEILSKVENFPGNGAALLEDSDYCRSLPEDSPIHWKKVRMMLANKLQDYKNRPLTARDMRELSMLKLDDIPKLLPTDTTDAINLVQAIKKYNQFERELIDLRRLSKMFTHLKELALKLKDKQVFIRHEKNIDEFAEEMIVCAEREPEVERIDLAILLGELAGISENELIKKRSIELALDVITRSSQQKTEYDTMVRAVDNKAWQLALNESLLQEAEKQIVNIKSYAYKLAKLCELDMGFFAPILITALGQEKDIKEIKTILHKLFNDDGGLKIYMHSNKELVSSYLELREAFEQVQKEIREKKYSEIAPVSLPFVPPPAFSHTLTLPMTDETVKIILSNREYFDAFTKKRECIYSVEVSQAPKKNRQAFFNYLKKELIEKQTWSKQDFELYVLLRHSGFGKTSLFFTPAKNKTLAATTQDFRDECSLSQWNEIITKQVLLSKEAIFSSEDPKFLIETISGLLSLIQDEAIALDELQALCSEEKFQLYILKVLSTKHEQVEFSRSVSRLIFANVKTQKKGMDLLIQLASLFSQGNKEFNDFVSSSLPALFPELNSASTQQEKSLFAEKLIALKLNSQREFEDIRAMPIVKSWIESLPDEKIKTMLLDKTLEEKPTDLPMYRIQLVGKQLDQFLSQRGMHDLSYADMLKACNGSGQQVRERIGMDDKVLFLKEGISRVLIKNRKFQEDLKKATSEPEMFEERFAQLKLEIVKELSTSLCPDSPSLAEPSASLIINDFLLYARRHGFLSDLIAFYDAEHRGLETEISYLANSQVGFKVKAELKFNEELNSIEEYSEGPLTLWRSDVSDALDASDVSKMEYGVLQKECYLMPGEKLEEGVCHFRYVSPVVNSLQMIMTFLYQNNMLEKGALKQHLEERIKLLMDRAIEEENEVAQEWLSTIDIDKLDRVNDFSDKSHQSAFGLTRQLKQLKEELDTVRVVNQFRQRLEQVCLNKVNVNDVMILFLREGIPGVLKSFQENNIQLNKDEFTFFGSFIHPVDFKRGTILDVFTYVNWSNAQPTSVPLSIDMIKQSMDAAREFVRYQELTPTNLVNQQLKEELFFFLKQLYSQRPGLFRQIALKVDFNEIESPDDFWQKVANQPIPDLFNYLDSLLVKEAFEKVKERYPASYWANVLEFKEFYDLLAEMEPDLAEEIELQGRVTEYTSIAECRHYVEHQLGLAPEGIDRFNKWVLVNQLRVKNSDLYDELMKDDMHRQTCVEVASWDEMLTAFESLDHKLAEKIRALSYTLSDSILEDFRKSLALPQRQLLEHYLLKVFPEPCYYSWENFEARIEVCDEEYRELKEAYLAYRNSMDESASVTAPAPSSSLTQNVEKVEIRTSQSKFTQFGPAAARVESPSSALPSRRITSLA